jgi:excisionase family DNA binding protein
MLAEPIASNMYVPNGNEASLAKVASRELSSLRAQTGEKVSLRITEGNAESPTVEVPRAALRFLVEILARMADGQPVRLMPLHAELTTQEAADLLCVSRPYLIKILDEGKLPYRRVGTHRRLYVADVLRYKEEEQAKRRVALSELVSLQQELGLDD